jgi:hypothetical protein
VWSSAEAHPNVTRANDITIEVTDYDRCARFSFNRTLPIDTDERLTEAHDFFEQLILGTLPPTYRCPEEPSPQLSLPYIAFLACFLLTSLLEAFQVSETLTWVLVAIPPLAGALMIDAVRLGSLTFLSVMAAGGAVLAHYLHHWRLVRQAATLAHTGTVALSCAAVAFPEVANYAVHTLQHGAGYCGG